MPQAKLATKPGSTVREPWHIDVMIEELRQKIRNDESFFARQVREGRMPQKAADFKLAAMRETVTLLEMIERAETALLRRAQASDGMIMVDTLEELILDWRRDLAERAKLAEARPAAEEKPITGVSGGQKSLLVYGATRGSA